MSWVTKAECKSAAEGVPEVNNTGDTYLDGVISRAENIVKRLTEQDFNKEEAITKNVDGSGNAILGLDIRLYSLDSLIVDTSVMTDYVYLKYGDNFSLLKFDPSFTHDYIFTFGIENITIVGNWGWPAVPDDIKTLTKLIVRNLCVNDANFRATTGAFLTEKIGDYSYSRSSLKDLKMAGIIDSEMSDTINKYGWFNAEDLFLY